MNFDRLARHYRWMEFVLAGEKLQRCRTAYLADVPHPRHLLLLGEGPGRCLVECLRRYPGAEITYVDSSQCMLKEAQRQLHREGLSQPSVHWIHSDILDWVHQGEPFDLVVTHFFLDCFAPESLPGVVAHISSQAAQQADWLLADFQVAPGKGLRRTRSQLVLRSMYRFFRLATKLEAQALTPPDPFLERAGFRLRSRREEDWGLLHSDWWQRGPSSSHRQ